MQEKDRDHIRGERPQHCGSEQDQGHYIVTPLMSVIVLLLALTAMPVELRQFDARLLHLQYDMLDLAINVIGYIPVGMLLGRMGLWRGISIATLLTVVAESSQFFMLHRYPAIADMVMNVVGALVGLFLNLRLRCSVPVLPLNPASAFLAVIAALPVLAMIIATGLKDRSQWRATKHLLVNNRGATIAGTLEAHWTFDTVVGRVVTDSSGNGLDGNLVGGVTAVEGKRGLALSFDGVRDCLDFGSPVALRLMGSMTITAWIYSTSFPVDDAAIVSSLDPGYQLDTTIDRGPRTIGFKLNTLGGEVIARYGQTVLVRDTWYHLAGVYDAEARTLSVYLNGQLDDGFLLGSVPAVQQATYRHVFVGRRPSIPGFEFAGLIDDVRIFSRALRKDEIVVAMNGGQTVDTPPGKPATTRAIEIERQRLPGWFGGSYPKTRSEHALLPGAMVLVGMLLAVVWAGFHPEHQMRILFVSLALGLLLVLVPGSALTLPWYTELSLPVLCVVGSFSVVVSLERRRNGPNSSSRQCRDGM
jgi:glycopeptide antibiotics resistance protein